MRIVALDESDLDAIAAIETLLFSPPRSKASYIEELANPNAILLGVKTDQDPILLGYILFWLYADEGHLHQLAVIPSHRRQGIGRALLLAMLEQAQAQGAVDVYLDVRPSNAPALALYRRYGFLEVGRRKGYYPDGEDAIVMKKERRLC